MAGTVQLLDSFEAVQQVLSQAATGLLPQPDADVFCTLPWFENLSQNGLAQDVAGKCLFLLGLDPDLGQAICLPLLHGRHLEGLANYYSSLYGPVTWHGKVDAAAGHQVVHPTDWQAMCRHLHKHPARWPVIRLGPLDTGAPFYPDITAALRSAGYWVDSFFCFGNWYLEVDGRTFDAYFQTLPSPLRHNLRRGQARLTRKGPWNITIHEQQGAAMESAATAFVQIYSQSWKGPEPNTSFIPGLARMAAHNGWLRLGVLELDGKPVAAQIWLVKSGKASIFKLAYVSGYERFSAGSILTAALMRHAIDQDKVHEVDYLTGDDGYKRDWMSHRRERRGVVAFNPGTAEGLWAAGRHFSGKLTSIARSARG